MNYRGSYRALLKNSKSAVLCAIEIYNKPQISYRDECFIILLVNAWELLAKAILSKNKQRIFYYKKDSGRNKPYRTFSLTDALKEAKSFFPQTISYEPVVKNIKSLVEYRDNSIHFYNQPGFGVVIHGLSQTSIINYRDLMLEVFAHDITKETTIHLLPLGFGNTPDPIEFLRDNSTSPPRNKFVAKYLQELVEVTKNLDEQELDTGRFLTKFNVKLESVKKITSADIVMGISGTSTEDSEGAIVAHKVSDSNISHPLKRKDILEIIGKELKGITFSEYTINAINYKHDIKNNKTYYWKAIGGGASQYSHDFVNFIRNLSKHQLEEAVDQYKKHQAEKRRKRKTKK